MIHDEDWGTEDRSRLVSDELSLASIFRPSAIRAALDRSVWKEGTLRASGVPGIFALYHGFKKARDLTRKLTGKIG